MEKTAKRVIITAVIWLLFIMFIPSAYGQRGGHHGGRPITRGVPHGFVSYGFHSGYYHVYHGGFYHGYYGYPRIGFRIRMLPFGFYPFHFGPDLYYYNSGIFYLPYNDGYKVVDPP